MDKRDVAGMKWTAEPRADLPIARNRIGEDWETPAADGFLEARSPGSGQAVGYVPSGARTDVARAVEAATSGAAEMRKLSTWDRAALLGRIAAAVENRQEELAQALAREQGKPIATEARGEIAFAVAGFRAAAEQIKWLEGATFSPPDPNKRGLCFRRQRGVYGIIVPWNYPVAVPVLYYLAPGLAAGNSFVWVPAPTTSIVSSLLRECIVEADTPAGVVNLVTGAGPVVGDEVAGHPGVHAVGFTGSTPVGRHVALRAAGKHVSLELGGNGPTIVFDDADVETAARKISLACFTNAGQVCTSTERILVHERVHDAFASAMSAVAHDVRLGDPLEETTTMGPLHNVATLRKVEEHIREGVDSGASVLTGTNTTDENEFATELYYPATVLTNVAPDSLLNVEETFGPVAPILSFRDDDHLRDLISRSGYGLFAGVFTNSLKRAFRWAEELKVGTVHVNERSSYWDINIPGGGASGSLSGVGRLGMKQSILQMSEEIAMTIDIA